MFVDGKLDHDFQLKYEEIIKLFNDRYQESSQRREIAAKTVEFL